MVSSGGPSLPLTDLTGKMAVFGRLFCEHVGVQDPAQIPTPSAAVDAVRARVPRTSGAAEDAPVFEAAAFLGEWIRSWADAAWVAEGPYEPHLQVLDPTRSVVYLLPLVSIVRVASTAGYDGLAGLIDDTMRDVLHPPQPSRLRDLRIRPEADRERVAAWVERHHHLKDASRATLWRRCATCSTLVEDAITLHYVSDDWERDASTAASILAKRPFSCACGGVPGEVSRFLLLREKDGDTRLADLFVGGNHTRIACWRLVGDRAEPLDATTLSVDTSASADAAYRGRR